jgi:hypothetical protein
MTSAPVAVVFTGSGHPGDTVFITDSLGNFGAVSGAVGANGSFAISANELLASGDQVSAHDATAGGPSANTVVVSGSVSTTAAPMSATISAGASIITVAGSPGQSVAVTGASPGPLAGELLGTGVVGSNGEVAVILNQPLPPNQPIQVVVGGVVTSSVSSSNSSVPPPQVNVGVVLSGTNVVTGTGVPGATVQAVDSLGNVLGTTQVNGQGNFSLQISGATAGQNVTIIENGVKAGSSLPSYTLNPEKAFTSANVFNPEKGGTLSIGFVAQSDGNVTVKVYNIAGTLVRPVFEASCSEGQQYQANWDGKNGDGSTVASGVYFISVRGAGIRTIRKVVVLK